MAVTPMNKDGVKRLPVAGGFRYPAGTSPARACYGMRTAAIGL